MILSGCDTETYHEEKDGIVFKGLKSIQLVTSYEEKYFIASDYTLSDDDIRCEICEQFMDYILNIEDELRIAFFNMTFDVSQFLRYMIA